MKPMLDGGAFTTERTSLQEFRTLFQPHLEKFIEEKANGYTSYIQDPLLVSIWNYPRRLAEQGKRVRPYVAYLMYRAVNGSRSDISATRESTVFDGVKVVSQVQQEFGEGTSSYNPSNPERVLPILVSLELFHLFCLVHDDIIDRGTERHSLPTLQRLVAAQMEEGNGLHDRCHIGNAQALLLGDILFAWAQEAFHTNRDFSAQIQREAQRYFNLMIDEVVIGEMLDVDMMTRCHTSRDSIEKKMWLKTASYTFTRPMQIGAALAGGSVAHEKFCEDFGFSLGVAFQIQDDLLDLVGTSATTQKTLFADLRDHQHTYFTQHIFEHGTPAQQQKLRELLGSDLLESDHVEILDLFESSGAFNDGRKRIEHHVGRACELIEAAPFRRGDKEPFYDLIASMRHRVPELKVQENREQATTVPPASRQTTVGTTVAPALLNRLFPAQTGGNLAA